ILWLEYYRFVNLSLRSGCSPRRRTGRVGQPRVFHLKWTLMHSEATIAMQDSTRDADSGASTTHFGYQTVEEAEKARKVAEVFHSVAAKYDVMNDLMSAGLHRAWKAFTIARADVRTGMKVLDIAGGTGDLSKAFARRVGKSGQVWLTDINDSMLRVGRDRMVDAGLLLPTTVCDAEKLPFPDGYFDRVSVAFGLRNMTHKDRALAEMRDRKSTRLNSSHVKISYAVFCLKKK